MGESKKQKTPISSLASPQEIDAYRQIARLFKETPIPENELLANLGLYLTRSSLSRIMFMNNLYLKIINTHGIIIEFGTRWGQNMALFSTFRNMYEPHNYGRKIVGFDTFEGFPAITHQDGNSESAQLGAYSVSAEYRGYLEKLLQAHEHLAPRGHLKKFELVQGDVEDTLPAYLERHPETVIALAYFDMDIYKPTKFCLEKIRNHLTKGSIVGFDELALDSFPGETLALKEAWGLSGYRICRDPNSYYQSFLVFD